MGGGGVGAGTGIRVGAGAGDWYGVRGCTCNGLMRVRAREGQDFTGSPRHHVTASPRHHVTASPRYHCTTLKC